MEVIIVPSGARSPSWARTSASTCGLIPLLGQGDTLGFGEEIFAFTKAPWTGVALSGNAIWRSGCARTLARQVFNYGHGWADFLTEPIVTWKSAVCLHALLVTINYYLWLVWWHFWTPGACMSVEKTSMIRHTSLPRHDQDAFFPPYWLWYYQLTEWLDVLADNRQN